MAAAAEADSIVYDVFESGRKLAEYRADAHWGAVHLGLNIARLGELRLGLLRGSGHAKASVGAPGFPTLDVAKAGATVRVVIDRLDNVDFPHHGMYGVLDGFFSRRRLGADLSYDRLAVGFNAFTTSGRQTYLLGLWGGSSLGSELPVYEEFTLGGLISLSGYRVGELRGQYFGVGRLGGYRRIGRLGGSFLEGVYFGGWAEAGNTWGDRNEIRLDNLRFAGTMFLGVETRLGPLSVAVGQAERGRRLIYLSLGRRL